MNIRQARKLHNGDEVIGKDTGESINVLAIEFKPYGYGTIQRKGTPLVDIVGCGKESGYRHWDHTEVK